MNIPEIEKLAEKLASRKVLVAVLAIYALCTVELPFESGWESVVRLAGISLIAMVHIISQAKLDKKEKPNEED